MKKYLSALALLMIVILAACGGETAPETTPMPEVNEPVTPAPEETNNDLVEDNSSNEPSTPDSNNDDASDPYDDPIIPSDGSEEEGYGSGGTSGGSNDNSSDDESDEENGMLRLTLSQLSQYDGIDGRRAFIAVDGLIYEVTNSSHWRNGTHIHNSNARAGRDLSILINSSPHGRGVLGNVPVVGTLINE
jgi:predicted heme/steroid binding protein